MCIEDKEERRRWGASRGADRTAKEPYGSPVMGVRLAVVQELAKDTGMALLCLFRITLPRAIKQFGFPIDCLLPDLRLPVFLLPHSHAGTCHPYPLFSDPFFEILHPFGH